MFQPIDDAGYAYAIIWQMVVVTFAVTLEPFHDDHFDILRGAVLAVRAAASSRQSNREGT
jgi:hypothetical protein